MVDFAMLGSLRVDGAAVTGRMQRTLLSVLLSRANEPVSVFELGEQLWPGRWDERAGRRLQLHVHRLRRLLNHPERLSRVDDGYHLQVLPGELDADRFDTLIRQAEASPEECVELVDAAMKLWRGEPFGGLDSPALADGAARLTERRLYALELRFAAELRQGRHAAAVAGLADVVAQNPLRERPAELLMTALYRSGRQAEALAVYRGTRQVLVDELGVEPGIGLRLLERRVLAGEPIDSDPPATNLAPAPLEPRPVPAQLPHDVGAFTGRELELAHLDTVEPPAVVLVSGTAGVGKTALAVRWAHGARGRFPDGQLYVDLRGYGPDDAVCPHEALTGILRSLGVSGTDVPTDTTERSAMFRTVLADRRMLIVLDNANAVEQVRPLLPGGRSSLVVVTSRDALTGLVAREGARRVHLERMPAGDAVRLFQAMAGPAADADRDAVHTLVEACARLPLALRVAAEQMSCLPGMRVPDLVAELGGPDRLDALDLDDPPTAVRSVFSWSYTNLDPQVARLFRLYGLHPGQDLGANALAAMADLDVRATRQGIRSLTRSGMVERSADDRLSPHDLMREYARERALAEETQQERAATLRRLCTWYLHSALAARLAVAPEVAPLVPTGAPPPQVPAFADRSAGLSWFDAERPNLVAVIRHASASDPDLAWQLAASTLAYFNLTKHWDDWLTTHELGLAAARACNDPGGTGRILNGMGVAYDDLGRLHDAVASFEEARAMLDGTPDRAGLAWTLNNLGVSLDHLGRFTEALTCFWQAFDLFTELDHVRGQALVLYNIGDIHLQTGDVGYAVDMIQRALAIQKKADDVHGQRFTLMGIGDLNHAADRHADACSDYGRALAISRELGDQQSVVRLLKRLAQVEDALGNHAAADGHAREAAQITEELGHRAVRNELTPDLALL